MDLGYARVSTTKQDLDRQIGALAEVGVRRDRIYADKKSGATTARCLRHKGEEPSCGQSRAGILC
jgi:DNA invertase Pin-like site-specific DNA recombinase